MPDVAASERSAPIAARLAWIILPFPRRPHVQTFLISSHSACKQEENILFILCPFLIYYRLYFGQNYVVIKRFFLLNKKYRLKQKTHFDSRKNKNFTLKFCLSFKIQIQNYLFYFIMFFIWIYYYIIFLYMNLLYIINIVFYRFALEQKLWTFFFILNLLWAPIYSMKLILWNSGRIFISWIEF